MNFASETRGRGVPRSEGIRNRIVTTSILSKPVMKNFVILPLLVGLALVCSCQKQPNEEEKKGEIEREVQQRLAAEHQAQRQQELDQRESDLAAREKALPEKEAAASKPRAIQTPRSAARQDGPPDRVRPTASYSTFYTQLDSYGDWRETADYGYVWQPYEAARSRGWRPYTDGRWVYTDVGWMWVSEEPFGWAAYHYGRWIRLRHIGWVWVPGDEWAPAWVSWRKGNNYIGWAPLPPEAQFDRRTGIRNWADNYYDIGPDQYCFVPTPQFGAQRVSPTIIPSERNVTIVSETTNVTNITYNNTTVVNQGPDYYELRTRTRQPIEHLRVERRSLGNFEGGNARAVVKGEVIEVSAPEVAKAQPAERPRRLKKSNTQTTVDRGWESVPDPQAAEKARAKIRSESTPPPDAPARTFVKPVRSSSRGNLPFKESTPVPIASSTESPANVQVPDEKPSKQSEARQGRRNEPGPSPAPDKSATPTQSATAAATSTPMMTPTATLAPAVTSDKFAKPKFHEKGERKNLDRGSVGPKFEPRQTEPKPTPDLSVSPSATPDAQAVDRKQRKKEEKENKREKKERHRPGESASPIPTPEASD